MYNSSCPANAASHAISQAFDNASQELLKMRQDMRSEARRTSSYLSPVIRTVMLDLSETASVIGKIAKTIKDMGISAPVHEAVSQATIGLTSLEQAIGNWSEGSRLKNKVCHLFDEAKIALRNEREGWRPSAQEAAILAKRPAFVELSPQDGRLAA